MAHHNLDLEGIATLLPISCFINGDKDYIEVTNPNFQVISQVMNFDFLWDHKFCI